MGERRLEKERVDFYSFATFFLFSGSAKREEELEKEIAGLKEQVEGMHCVKFHYSAARVSNLVCVAWF